jgi:hypothetical protein
MFEPPMDDDWPYWKDDKPTPGDDEIEAISHSWLDYQRTEDEKHWWACEAVMEAAISDPTPEMQSITWRLILTLCSLAEDDLKLILDIGAGPLEEFIRLFGDNAMDLIEPAVATNRTLLRALAGVWGWDEPVRPRVDRVLAIHGQERL